MLYFLLPLKLHKNLGISFFSLFLMHRWVYFVFLLSFIICRLLTPGPSFFVFFFRFVICFTCQQFRYIWQFGFNQVCLLFCCCRWYVIHIRSLDVVHVLFFYNCEILNIKWMNLAVFIFTIIFFNKHSCIKVIKNLIKPAKFMCFIAMSLKVFLKLIISIPNDSSCSSGSAT